MRSKKRKLHFHANVTFSRSLYDSSKKHQGKLCMIIIRELLAKLCFTPLNSSFFSLRSYCQKIATVFDTSIIPVIFMTIFSILQTIQRVFQASHLPELLPVPAAYIPFRPAPILQSYRLSSGNTFPEYNE